MVDGFTTTTTKVVSSNPIHGEEYFIQHYVIKFVSDFATGRWFSPGIPVSSTYKTIRHDITEILLKMALNTINQLILLYSLYWMMQMNMNDIEGELFLTFPLIHFL